MTVIYKFVDGSAIEVNNRTEEWCSLLKKGVKENGFEGIAFVPFGEDSDLEQMFIINYKLVTSVRIMKDEE